MRLSAQQLLDTDWEPSGEPGRPPRHTYRLTAEGVALARARLEAAAARTATTQTRAAIRPIVGPA